MQKTLFEWVLIVSKGDDVILSENQYDIYKNSWRDGQMFFNGMMVNPAFVAQAYKRPAEVLKKKYPCKDCFSSGFMTDKTICTKCEGAGAILP